MIDDPIEKACREWLGHWPLPAGKFRRVFALAAFVRDQRQQAAREMRERAASTRPDGSESAATIRSIPDEPDGNSPRLSYRDDEPDEPEAK